ncbi:MAG: 50S ribosomal protein L11 methyltransferase, partial [Bacteroidota bacterium]
GALKLGAAHVIGFDIDPWAQENVLENLDLNEARSQFEFREGAIDAVPEDGFDLILANINRNVLIDLVPVFAHKLAASGRLILAGLLRSDTALMTEHAAQHRLYLAASAQEGDWWSGVFRLAT